MVFSMFSAVSVSAAGEKGMALSGSLSKDGKTITIDVDAVGNVGALDNFAVVINVPNGIMNDDVSIIADVPMMTNVYEGVLYVAFLDLTGKGRVFEDNHLVTIKLRLSSPLSYNYTATLQPESGMQDQDGAIYVEDGTMDAASITIKKWSGA